MNIDIMALRGLISGRTASELDPDHVRLARLDYRRARTFLAPHVFAIGGDIPDPDPNDLMERGRWEHVMHLADDVALRTSSYTGSAAARMSSLAYTWLLSFPDDPDDAPYVHEVALGAHEEFEAMTFIALHGFYRQSLGCLRNAFELMTHAAALALRADKPTFERWRAAEIELRFRESRETLLTNATDLERMVAPASVFGDTELSWSRRLYKRLSGYAHSQAGRDNAAFWESNGPVYRPQTHLLAEAEMREIVAYCALCMKLGWPGFALGDLDEVLAEPGDEWSDVASGVRAFIEAV